MHNYTTRRSLRGLRDPDFLRFRPCQFGVGEEGEKGGREKGKAGRKQSTTTTTTCLTISRTQSESSSVAVLMYLMHQLTFLVEKQAPFDGEMHFLCSVSCDSDSWFNHLSQSLNAQPLSQASQPGRSAVIFLSLTQPDSDKCI